MGGASLVDVTELSLTVPWQRVKKFDMQANWRFLLLAFGCQLDSEF